MDSSPDTVPEEYRAANALIHGAIELVRERLTGDELFALALQQALGYAQNLGYKHLQPSSAAISLIKSHPELVEPLRTAIETGRYDKLMSLPALQKKVPSLVEWTNYVPVSTGAAKVSWKGEYQGDYHVTLLRNINAMKQEDARSTSVALIQSSGAGKSRMVDQLATLVFTIPFNLRAAKESLSAAYPPPDTEVADYLCKPVTTVTEGVARTSLFFAQLFSQVADEVTRVFGKAPCRSGPEDIAVHWKKHLETNGRRASLYRTVIQSCHATEASSGLHNLPLNVLFTNLVRHLERICTFPQTCGVKVMLYFDEAHELHHPIKDGKEQKMLYDVVCLTLHDFRCPEAFTIFLSTQSSTLRLLAPPADTVGSSRQENTSVLPAPITETPFDCSPGFPLRPGQFKLEDLRKLPFLARFGRPLFWSMIEANREHEALAYDTMDLARTKLLRRNDIYAGFDDHPPNASLAILDVLITIDYEPSCAAAQEVQNELVASHMRTVYSIPQDHAYMRSGYSSEPFLAEAASRQMHQFLYHRRTAMVDLFEWNRRRGLIDLGQKDEMVMRLLLRKAYMDAIANEQSQKEMPNFSRGCGFLQFLKALFPNKFHNKITTSTPDNIADAPLTLGESFKDAVVRFTHFIKAVDSSILQTDAMVFAFLRGAAFIRHKAHWQEDVDIVIPILLGRDLVVEEVSMSALLIQVKRRKKREIGAGAYIIDEQTFGFFPRGSSPSPSPTNERLDSRSYVTLVAELGANLGDDSLPAALPPNGQRRGRSPPRTVKLPHPRYSLRAYGCTDATWNVVRETEVRRLTRILGMDDVLADHPRQHSESLQLVRQMLPFWSPDAPWFRVSDSEVGLQTGTGTARAVCAEVEVGAYVDAMDVDVQTGLGADKSAGGGEDMEVEDAEQ